MKRSSIAVYLGLVGALASGGGWEGEASVTGAAEAAQVGSPELTPAYWNVDALADSPSPGSEPINVIITTNLPMDAIVAALQRTRQPEQGRLTWGPVPIGVGLKGCISEELASIDGDPVSAGATARRCRSASVASSAARASSPTERSTRAGGSPRRAAARNPGAVQPDPRDPTKSSLKRGRWDGNATHCAIMERSR